METAKIIYKSLSKLSEIQNTKNMLVRNGFV